MTTDPYESTTAELISLVYDLQGTLRMLAELLAKDRNNPISPQTWNFLSCAQYYLRSDIAPRIH